MDIFLGLPFELARNLSVHWCSVKDLAVLDTAYCNKPKRELWEKVLRSTNQFESYTFPNGNFFGVYQTYTLTRRIKTKKLVVEDGENFELLAGYLEELGGSIEEVICEGIEDSGEFGSIISLLEMHCNHIIGLTCSSCELDPIVMNLLRKPSLVRLKIENCTELQQNTMTWQTGKNRISYNCVLCNCAVKNFAGLSHSC